MLKKKLQAIISTLKKEIAGFDVNIYNSADPFTIYYNTTTDSIDYTDGTWTQITSATTNLTNISQIKLCVANPYGLGAFKIGTTLGGTELGSGSGYDIIYYTRVQTLSENANYYVYGEED